MIYEHSSYLLSSSTWTSASERGIRGGHPSIMQPTPPPRDSPYVVTRKYVPKVFPDACTSGFHFVTFRVYCFRINF